MEQRWKALGNHDRCDIELVMRSNSLQVINEQSATRLVTDELVTGAAHSYSLLHSVDHVKELSSLSGRILKNFGGSIRVGRSLEGILYWRVCVHKSMDCMQSSWPPRSL